MPDINDIDGRPAIETDEPMSIQEANLWALEQRDKADARKAAVERLRCDAAERRERKPANPLETLKPDTSYRVREFNAEADAFNVDGSDGKKLLGKSLSNGNVRNGQKVRSFFAPNGQVVIDVKPKGRDIVIPKPVPKLPADEEYWPVTSCFLYSRIKPNKEKLTGNGAAQGVEETSWDSIRGVYSNTAFNSYAYGFAERLDDLGNYKTAQDALDNKLRPECLIVPTGGGSTGAARDNAAVSSGSEGSVIVWFYIGSLNQSATELVDSGSGKIYQVSGPSMYPENQNTEQGPGFCMEMYRQGSISAGLYPSASFGLEPLSYFLKNSFPDLGGKIGYWGGIKKWRGIQDLYSDNSHRTFFYRSLWAAFDGDINAVPTSFPPEFVAGVSPWPGTLEHNAWYRYGWDNQYIATMSAGAIGVNVSALDAAGVGCGDVVPNDQWFWSRGIGASAGALDRYAHYSSASGMFVCWQGHKENIGLATSFFQTFGTYWNIDGGSTVTRLGSANPYGCEIPNSGGGYPPAPPSDASRFLVDAYGRKAKVLLVCHKQDYEPIEIELPFEFAAVIEEHRVLGGGSFSFGTNFESGKSRNFIQTYTSHFIVDPFSLDLTHGTLSIDKDFAYVDIFYGGERIYEEPKTFPLPIRLASQGFGSPRTGFGSNYGNDISLQQALGIFPLSSGMYESGFPQTPAQTNEKHPRIVKDCWSRCRSFKVRLPTKEDKTLTIVGDEIYDRGESITLTANNPDSEFNNKFLIRDYRTDDRNLTFKTTNPEFASFGGLPALTQQMFIGLPYTTNPTTLFTNNDISIGGLLYKNKQDWTAMDWIHYQLQEMPRQFNPLTTVLPVGVSISQSGVHRVNMIYDLDNRFGRQGRAERIMEASSFGWNGSFTGGQSPSYGSGGGVGPEILFTSHKEQMIGNGLKEDGVLTKWYRVTTSSFPVFGQLLRNS